VPRGVREQVLAEPVVEVQVVVVENAFGEAVGQRRRRQYEAFTLSGFAQTKRNGAESNGSA